MKLNELRDREGARKLYKRVGRGIGSGCGKTSGRGIKGQKSRSGVSIKGFEGGQMPIYRRLPKRGFNNASGKYFNIVSLDRIQAAIDSGRLDDAKIVSIKELKDAGIVRHVKDGVRLLSDGKLSTKITLKISGASRTAIAKVEEVGGSVILPGAVN